MDANWLFHPLTYDDFNTRCFEREVCVITRHNPRYYGDVLSIADLDTVLSTHRASHPDINVVQHGKDIPRQSFTTDTGRIDPVQTSKLFAQGATVIFTQLQGRLPALGRLCADMEKLLSQRMQTNIYLTPADAQGFPPHWDTHDVFVLQISGTKHWSIYNTQIDLPLRGQSFERGEYTIGPVSQEFEIGPGDMVYVPRGVIHSARSTDQESLHITVGMMGPNWTELLLQAVGIAATTDRSLRQSLPLGWAREDSGIDLMALYQERIATLGQLLASLPPPFEDVAADLTGNYSSLNGGLLKRALDAMAVSRSTLLRVRPEGGWELHTDDHACYLRSGSRELKLPARVLPILQSFAREGTSRISDLPDAVDEAGKLVLVRRLITEGLLECA
jgi:hypothetical protein